MIVNNEDIHQKTLFIICFVDIHAHIDFDQYFWQIFLFWKKKGMLSKLLQACDKTHESVSKLSACHSSYL